MNSVPWNGREVHLGSFWLSPRWKCHCCTFVAFFPVQSLFWCMGFTARSEFSTLIDRSAVPVYNPIRSEWGGPLSPHPLQHFLSVIALFFLERFCCYYFKLCVCGGGAWYMDITAGAWGGQKGQSPLKLALQSVVSHPTLGLGNSGTSKAVCTFLPAEPSLQHHKYFLFFI